MKKILVLGSLNMDLVTQVDHIPKTGETILGQGMDLIPGGKGANQALAISKLGGQVAMVGRVGQDAYGKILVDNLASQGVQTKGVKALEGQSSGLAFIMVSGDGDNSIVVIPGANSMVTHHMVSDELLESVDMILCQMEIPLDAIEHIMIRAGRKGVTRILNPAPAGYLSKELLGNLDMIIPNENEFMALTGKDPRNAKELEAGMNYFFTCGLKEVIVTLGSHGAVYQSKVGKKIHVDAYKVNAVDTTAAGDSFIGGFLSRLAMGWAGEEAMDYGMMVGALTVSRKGAQSSLPTEEEVDTFKKSIG